MIKPLLILLYSLLVDSFTINGTLKCGEKPVPKARLELDMEPSRETIAELLSDQNGHFKIIENERKVDSNAELMLHIVHRCMAHLDCLRVSRIPIHPPFQQKDLGIISLEGNGTHDSEMCS